MDSILEWLGNNYNWVFSGVGVFILGGLVAFFKKKKTSEINQSQRAGKNSTNIQAGGNVEFTQKNEK